MGFPYIVQNTEFSPAGPLKKNYQSELTEEIFQVTSIH